MLTRRFFLKSSGLAFVSFGLAPRALVRSVHASEGSRNKKTLVVVFQRGACDGLNTVVPYGEPAYRKLRPTIAIPALPDTVVTAGPGVFIVGRMDDATGIDTLYVDVTGGVTRYPPLDQDGRRGVAFALPFTTSGQEGEEIVVLIHGVDVLGNRGSAVRRRILVE